MLLRRLFIVSLCGLALLCIGLLFVRYLITRSITCMPRCVGANLSTHDLHGQDLHRGKFLEAQLQNADLSQANLREADLSGANLMYVNLRGADLTDARLIGTDLSGARLEGCILNRTDLSGANLTGADLTNVDLRSAVVGGVNFSGAKLTNVQLQGANLSGLNFSKASLAGIKLNGAKLAGAVLSQADLSGAILVDVDVTGAWMNQANLVGTDLTNADLSGSSLIGAKLSSANLQQSKLVGATLVGAYLDGANAREASFANAITLRRELPAKLLAFLDGSQNPQEQDLAFVQTLDPALQELNQAERKTLLFDTDLNGIAFDSQTVWPAGREIVIGGDAERSLPLTYSSEGTAPANDASTTLVDKNVAPAPRRVAVNFFINSIRNIQDETSEYRGDFYLDIYWHEPTLSAEQDVTELDPTKLWNPQLTLVNSVNGKFLYEIYDNSIEPETNVRLSYRAIGDFVSNFDLRRFPFDQQRVVIELEPKVSNSDSVVLEFIDSLALLHSEDNSAATSAAQPYVQKISKGRYVESHAVGGEWKVDSARIIQQNYLYPHDLSSRSRFQIELTIARQSAPYLWKYIMPLILLSIFAWSVCLLDAKDLTYRFWMLTSLIVCLAALHASMVQKLPHVPYMTYLDRFLILHYTVLIVLVLWVVALSLLQRRDFPRLTRWLSQGLAIGYPIGYLGLNLLLYLR